MWGINAPSTPNQIYHNPEFPLRTRTWMRRHSRNQRTHLQHVHDIADVHPHFSSFCPHLLSLPPEIASSDTSTSPNLLTYSPSTPALMQGMPCSLSIWIQTICAPNKNDGLLPTTDDDTAIVEMERQSVELIATVYHISTLVCSSLSLGNDVFIQCFSQPNLTADVRHFVSPTVHMVLQPHETFTRPLNPPPSPSNRDLFVWPSKNLNIDMIETKRELENTVHSTVSAPE